MFRAPGPPKASRPCRRLFPQDAITDNGPLAREIAARTPASSRTRTRRPTVSTTCPGLPRRGHAPPFVVLILARVNHSSVAPSDIRTTRYPRASRRWPWVEGISCHRTDMKIGLERLLRSLTHTSARAAWVSSPTPRPSITASSMPRPDARAPWDQSDEALWP